VDSPNRAITTLLQRWAEGDQAAGSAAIEQTYTELRRLAAHYLRLERADHTLQPTALVHEIYLRLEGKGIQWADRKHFFVVAAGQIRRILVDHARARQAEKRGGPEIRVVLEEADARVLPPDEVVLALDAALEELRQEDERMAAGVELRYFGGFSEQEAAQILGISVATLKRDWSFARAWLLRRLS
jgi:RNA polymerase sigma factor (TIGR02999 family)